MDSNVRFADAYEVGQIIGIWMADSMGTDSFDMCRLDVKRAREADMCWERSHVMVARVMDYTRSPSADLLVVDAAHLLAASRNPGMTGVVIPAIGPTSPHLGLQRMMYCPCSSGMVNA